MRASANSPPHAIRLFTYAELDAYVRAFAAGHLQLLLLFGLPGVGKSRCVRQALDQRVGWISGQATPLGIYLEAYAHRHQPLVLDDVDGLYADRSGIRLLKALCQTERVKTLGWHTTTPILELRDVPHQFTTTSRVALVGNDWKTLNADVAALEDRGHVLLFEPTALEVHRQAAGWFCQCVSGRNNAVKSFIRRHGERINGILECFDRVLIGLTTSGPAAGSQPSSSATSAPGSTLATFADSWGTG